MRNTPKTQTQAEEVLWQGLKKIPKVFFVPQGKVLEYTPDFWCEQFKLAIEVDGRVHNKKDVREKDYWKGLILKNNKIFILRFTNGQVNSDLDGCLETVKETIERLKQRRYKQHQLRPPRFKVK